MSPTIVWLLMRRNRRHGGWRMDNDDLAIAAMLFVFAIIAALAIGFLVYKIAFERNEFHGIVLDRSWNSVTSTTYTTTEVDVTTGPDGDVSISSHTETHVRCRDHLQGTELPVIYAESSCKIRDDRIRHSVNYWINYRLEESSEILTIKFPGELWHVMEPGNKPTIVVNGLGSFVEAR